MRLSVIVTARICKPSVARFDLLANQTLDGKRLDQTALQPDRKASIRSTDQQHDALTSQCLLDVVVLVIDIHPPVSAHFAGKPPPMDGIEPAIWVDSFGQGRQRRQAGKGDLWWPIATGRSPLAVAPGCHATGSSWWPLAPPQACWADERGPHSWLSVRCSRST